jgi:hypothetical protein
MKESYFIITGDYQYKDPYTGKIQTVFLSVWSQKNWTEERLKAKKYDSRKSAEAAVDKLKNHEGFRKAKNISVQEIIPVRN